MMKPCIKLHLLLSFYGVVNISDGFVVTSTPSSLTFYHGLIDHSTMKNGCSCARRSLLSALYSAKEDLLSPLPHTDDPYLILGISTPTADKKVIKRAYRRMALKYHPDVRLNSTSTEQERKIANDDFAKINAAYAMLTGKSGNESSSTNGRGSPSGSSRTNSQQSNKYSYTPPHRRTGQSQKSSYSWEDFMPKYDEEDYDTNGDSFAAIFSDMLSELGNSAADRSKRSASILNDFVSFLEGNFPSVGNAQQVEEDIILDTLLKEGSIEEIKLELDDAKLLVKQLEGKERDLVMELSDLSKQPSGLGQTTSYMDQMRIEEQRREIKARKDIVEEYLGHAKLRLVKLKRRYDELRIGETRSSRTYQGSEQENTSNTRRNSSKSNNKEEAWKNEGFSSSSRSRGRGRARTRSQASSAANRQSSTYNSPSDTATSSSDPYSSTSNYSYLFTKSPYNSTRRNASQQRRTSKTSESMLPPHRRITSQVEEDMESKRRLREIKVDEEIDKLKKEMGL